MVDYTTFDVKINEIRKGFDFIHEKAKWNYGSASIFHSRFKGKLRILKKKGIYTIVLLYYNFWLQKKRNPCMGLHFKHLIPESDDGCADIG